jgi:hypothetical protein
MDLSCCFFCWFLLFDRLPCLSTVLWFLSVSRFMRRTVKKGSKTTLVMSVMARDEVIV